MSNKHHQAEKFQWDPQKYHENSKVQYFSALKILSKYQFKENEEVLDVGCGDGKISAYIADKVGQGRVIGIDKSRSMIDFAISYHKNEDYPNLFFMNMDANEIREIGVFDVIFSSFCIQWIEKIRFFFKTLSSLLKPGGVFLATIPAGISNELDFSLYKSMNDCFWEPFFKEFVQNWSLRSEATYRKALLSSDFTIQECNLVYRENQFKTISELKNYIGFSFPHSSYIPFHLREKFLDEVAYNYLKELGLNNQKNIPFNFPIVEIRTQKPSLEFSYSKQ